MMTQEQAKAKLATAETKVEHLEAVSNRLEWLANETDGTRFAATEDWKLFGRNKKVDNEFWWTLEDAINELFAAKNLCDEQLNRERNKVKVLADYLTRFENEATPATVTDADETNRDFDETRIRLFPDDVRALWLSQQWTWDIDVKADDDDGKPVEVTEEDFADIEGTLRGRYWIDWDGFGGISFFAEDADDEELNLILAELDLRGCRIVENYEEWEVNKAEEDAAE